MNPLGGDLPPDLTPDLDLDLDLDQARAPDLDLLLYTGKGGVGKTTTAAATALRASSLGRRTLVVSADPAHSLGDVLGLDLGACTLTGPLDAQPGEPLPAVEVSSKLFAVELDARFEVRRQWARIHDYLVRLLTHHGVEGTLASELATLPGVFELATLLAVDRAVAGGEYDLVVVDCAPTASALRMTTLPDVARGMLRVVLGVLRNVSSLAAPLAQRVVAAPLPDAAVFESMESLLYRHLTSLRRRLVAPTSAVRIVVTPERMVVDEARRAYTDLCLFELPVDAVVINRVLPASGDDDPFWCEMQAAQAVLRDEIRDAFEPLPVLEAPYEDEEVIGLPRLSALGDAIFGARDPGARLAAPSANLRFWAEGDETLLRLPLPGITPGELQVAKVEGDLVITTARRRRALPLPRRVARQILVRARLEAGLLELAFAEPAPDAPCG